MTRRGAVPAEAFAPLDGPGRVVPPRALPGAVPAGSLPVGPAPASAPEPAAEADRAVDPARLARAIHLEVQRLAGQVYRVSGGARPHRVTVAPHGMIACDCWDAATRPGRCKHALAVRVLRLDPDLRAALRVLVAVP